MSNEAYGEESRLLKHTKCSQCWEFEHLPQFQWPKQSWAVNCWDHGSFPLKLLAGNANNLQKFPAPTHRIIIHCRNLAVYDCCGEWNWTPCHNLSQCCKDRDFSDRDIRKPLDPAAASGVGVSPECLPVVCLETSQCRRESEVKGVFYLPDSCRDEIDGEDYWSGMWQSRKADRIMDSMSVSL